ncbi:MAG: M24 family metallopeptidase [Candidatus Latescibacteria bacterium]|nr:M24 family metallopeptidase [Candidatus Latescibacterota bacterium]
MVKSEEEIARLARAAQIAEEAARVSLSQAGPGKSFLELSRLFRSEVARQGADLDHFAYSPRGLGIATEPDYLLAADEVMYVDFGCVFGNYCSDSGLTLALRPLEGELRRRYAALRQGLEAGVAAMRPGARASQVHWAMKDYLKVEGITASFPHGHGWAAGAGRLRRRAGGPAPGAGHGAQPGGDDLHAGRRLPAPGAVLRGGGTGDEAAHSPGPAAALCAGLDSYPLSGMKVGMATPRKGEKAPRTWQKWSSQLRAPQA